MTPSYVNKIVLFQTFLTFSIEKKEQELLFYCKYTVYTLEFFILFNEPNYYNDLS